MSNYPHGSEWRKWDLHVHSPDSFENAFVGGWDTFLIALKAVNDVAVLGVTDYFSIDGYKKILVEREAGHLQNYACILPNVELRLDVFVPTERQGATSRRLNLHVIFAEDVSPDDIEREFLQCLSIPIRGQPGEEDQVRTLCRQTIEDVGRRVKQEQDDFRGDSDFDAGCKNITVNLDDMKKQLKKSCFSGKALVILAAEGWNLIDWGGQGYHTRRRLLESVDAVFSGNPSTALWLSGRGDLPQADFIREFGCLKPCLHGSDAHTLDRLCRPDQNRFCWIKADPTFQGLMQVVYEPCERVTIQASSPTTIEGKLCISGISIPGSEGFLLPIGTALAFNRGMVAVVGGRGSGKSALTETLAFCFDKHAKFDIGDKPRFIPYYLREGAKADVVVTTADRDGNAASGTRRLGGNDDPIAFPFEYLGQNRIEDFASDSAGLHRLVSNTVLETSGQLELFQDLQRRIGEQKARIIELQTQLAILVGESTSIDIASIREQKRQKEEEKRLLSSEQTRDILARLSNAAERRNAVQAFVAGATELAVEIKTIANDLNTRLHALEEAGTKVGIRLSSKLVLVGEIITALTDAANSPIVEEAQADLNAVTEEARTCLQDNADVSVEHVAFLTNEVDRLSEEITYWEESNARLGDLRVQRSSAYADLVQLCREQLDAYTSAIDEFSRQGSGILGDVIFKAELNFDLDALLRVVHERFVDKRKCRVVEQLKTRLSIPGLDEYVKWIERMDGELEEIDCFNDQPPGELAQFFLSAMPQLSTGVSLRVGETDVPLARLSLGQKGTVVLKLFLATGSCPIVFDQPEDHLDNAFIFDTLVPTLIAAKKKRQVIVVTHNANVVINGDAEQVVVARFEEGVAKYDSGAIEDPGIRAKLLDILEGGREAFDRRERRYSLRGEKDAAIHVPESA